MKSFIPIFAWEKTLLHLMKYARFEEKFEAPIEITQKGISDGTKIGIPHIPRTIQGLQEKEYVFERRKNVKGKRQRVKSYYLTNDGMSYAIDLKERLIREKISFLDLNDEIKELTVAQFQRKLEIPSSLLEIIISINKITEKKKKKELIMREFYEELKRLKSTFVNYNKFVPTNKNFFGRKDELSKIKELFNDHNVITILGIPGIGKTSLSVKLFEEYKSSKHLFWYHVNEWNTLKGIMKPFSEFLSQLNKESLNKYIKSGNTIELEEVSTILENDLKDANVLLIFDNIHKIENKIAMFFSILIKLAGSINGINILFLARHLPPYKLYDYRDKNIKGAVSEFQLKGLDLNGSREILESRDIKMDELSLIEISKTLQGHPLFLTLIPPLDNIEFSLTNENEIKRFIQEEIIMNLSEKELLVLSIISVFRYPVESMVFLNNPQISFEILEELREKSLIEEIRNDRYNTHDWIKEFFYSRLTPQLKIKYHEDAAHYYTLKKEDYAQVEGPYHFLKSEKRNNAIKLIIENGSEIIKNGYTEDLKEILNEIDDGDQYQEFDKLLLLKGNLFLALRDFDKAIECYLKSIDISLEDDITSNAYRNVGHIYKEMGEWKLAVENFEDAMEISERINDFSGIAEAHRGIGQIYLKQGILEGAIIYYEECIEYSKKAGDIATNALASYDLGIIYEKKGEHEKAVENYLTSLKLYDAIGNVYQKGKVFKKLGKSIVSKKK